jgi:hypothetical protein
LRLGALAQNARVNELAVALTILGLVVMLGVLAPRYGADSRDGFRD